MSDIQDKIRKLLSVSRDSGATEAEQAQALKLAQRLMLKHGITEVKEENQEVDWGNVIDDLDKKHHRTVAAGVAKLYGTQVIIDGKNFQFVGRPDTRDASEFTVNFICDQIDMLYRDALPKGMTKSQRAQWRREFKAACAYRVYSRMLEMVEELSTDDEQAQAAIGCTALVVKNHYVALIEEVDAFLTGKTKPRKSRPTVFKNKEAMDKGRLAGNKVKINQEVDKTMPKQLASKQDFDFEYHYVV